MRKILSTSLAVLSLIFIVPAHATDAKQLEVNKQIVTSFYNEAINNKNFDAAAQYLGSRYTQHNPTVIDGPQGLKNFVDFLRANYPNAHSEIKRVLADGDYVILQIHSVREPGTRGRVVFDLFKLENDKIVEHWDAHEEIPETSANDNGVF